MQGEQRRAFVRATLVVLAITSALCGVVLVNNRFDPLVFAHIGTRFANRATQGANAQGSIGYDGQFVYFIARDGADAVPYIDGPSLRYQRIGLPVAARALALGNPALVGWTLLLINVVAHSVGAGLVSYILRGFNAPAVLGGLTYGLWIGGLLGVRFDLTEPLCFVLALGAVVAYQRERFLLATFLLMLSTVTKELGLVVATGLALHAFFHGRRSWAVLLFGAPLTLFLTWWGILRLWFGTLPTVYPAGRGILPIPLNGLFTVQNPVEFAFLAVWLAVPAVVLFVWAGYVLWRCRADVPLAAALMLPGAGFVLLMPGVSWQDHAAAYRVAMSLVVAGLLFVGQVAPRRLPLLCLLWLTPLMLLLMVPALWVGA